MLSHGAGASTPTSCQNNGVFAWIHNVNPDATMAHAVILLEWAMRHQPDLDTMMIFQVERAFGRVLGAGLLPGEPLMRSTATNPTQLNGWPVMEPLSGTAAGRSAATEHFQSIPIELRRHRPRSP